MMNRSKRQLQIRLFGGVLLTLLCSVGLMARAVDTLPATLSCAPDLPREYIEDEQFTFASGKALMIGCTAQSTVNGEFSAMLLGKQTDAQNNVAASGADMLVTTTSAKVTLQFPAVFQSGRYQYSFTLLDTKTRQPIAKEVTLVGVIEGDKQARIIMVALNQEKYEWQAPATLNLSVALPENKTLETLPLSLEISMSDTTGETCQTLVKNTAIRQPIAAYTFTFPEPGMCTNTLKIAIKNQDGTVIDEKVLAVGLPESPASTDSGAEQRIAPAASPMSRPLVIGLVLTVVVLLVLGAIHFIRKRR